MCKGVLISNLQNLSINCDGLIRILIILQITFNLEVEKGEKSIVEGEGGIV